MDFFPLHLHSAFSFFQSTLTAPRALKALRKQGYFSCGLADEATMSGYAPFHHELSRNNITLYFGLDITSEVGPMTLYAKDETGYRNLLKLYYKQQTEPTSEIEETEGLIAILDGHRFNVERLKEANYPLALARYSERFSHFYIGIPFKPLEEDQEDIKTLRDFAASHSYKSIAFPYISYVESSDEQTLKILKAIEEATNLDPETPPLKGFKYLLSKEEAAHYYEEEEINNLNEIPSLITFNYLTKRGELLHFPLDGETPFEALKRMSYEGLKKKVPSYDKTYEDRLNEELNTINKMGYDDYFLIVSDYVHFAKTHHILVGPGRGSAGGSLVAYALDIVEVDPIKHGLLFQRFLSEARQSLPDIDVDFEDTKREFVIAYLRQKYGVERVANILTTVYIGARQALHDIRRVFNFSDRDLTILLKAIGDDFASLGENYKRFEGFKKLVDSDPFYLNFVSLAAKIEGLPRQAGLHAAGVVIDQNPLATSLPCKIEPGVGSVACLEKDYLEAQGFLKMDILGLRNLSLIENCISLYEAHHHKRIDAYRLNYESEAAIKLIASGATAGLFQLESAGMKRTIQQVHPTKFSDVAALIALYRPGPMKQIPSFAARKAGREKITYPSPVLEPILKETYGIIVYQEQVMQIATAFAGFSLEKADIFRQAISKKNLQKMATLEKDFKEGAKALGNDEATINNVYNLIYRFADYGFNKAHATAYAMLATRMAYLKAKIPGEFYSAVLSMYSIDDKKFKEAYREARQRGYKLIVPDLNLSGRIIENVDNNLLLPLSFIKKIPSRLIDGIIDERQENGPFKDLFDIAVRLKPYGLTQQTLVRLIDAGALDFLKMNRTTLRSAAYSAISYSEMLLGSDGTSYLLDLDIEKPLIEEFIEDEVASLAAEKEALGAYISISPLTKYKGNIAKNRAITLDEALNSRGDFLTRGIVYEVEYRLTKNKEPFAFVRVYDELDEMSFTVFSNLLNKVRIYLQEGSAILIRGHGEMRKGYGINYIATEIKELDKDA